jgi:hypothetical protein
VTSENPAGGGAQAADQVKIASTYRTQPKTAVPSDQCQFCGAVALKPNRKERRQRGAGTAPFTMLHESWCRMYGKASGYRPRSRGGAVR